MDECRSERARFSLCVVTEDLSEQHTGSPCVPSSRTFCDVPQRPFAGTTPVRHFLRRLTRVGRCAVKGMLILAGAKPAR